jgi:hypothetical protein
VSVSAPARAVPVLGEEDGGQALAVICDAAVADVASGFVGKRGADEVVIGSKGRGKDGRWGTLLAFGLGQRARLKHRNDLGEGGGTSSAHLRVVVVREVGVLVEHGFEGTLPRRRPRPHGKTKMPGRERGGWGR